MLSSDGRPIEPYAMRSPAAKKCKSQTEHRLATMARDCGARVVDFMLKNGARAAEVWNFCEQLQKTANESLVDEAWTAQYRRVWRIPAAWWATWLAQHGGEHLTTQIVMKIKAKDERQVTAIGLHVTGLYGNMKLPPAMLSKQVAARTCAELAAKLNRWANVKQAVNWETGEVDLMRLSPYQITWGADDLASYIEYAGERVKIANGLRFSWDFKVRDPLVDFLCEAVGPNDMKGVRFCKLFPIGSGPHLVLMDEAGEDLKALAEKHARTISEQVDASREGQLATIDEGATPEVVAKKRLPWTRRVRR